MNKKDLDLNIKQWYEETYPSDSESQYMRDDKTFRDALFLLTSNDYYDLSLDLDFYDEILGDVDSVVRERVFDKLAEILGVDYKAVYDAWLKEIPNDLFTVKRKLLSVKESNQVKKTVYNANKRIKTFAIITAENPINYDRCNDETLPSTVALSRQENNERMQSLKDTLKAGRLNYDDSVDKWFNYSKVIGNYGGSKEHSLIVYNITLNEVKDLCKAYNQESFIYGLHNEKNDDLEVYTYVAIIDCKNKKVKDYKVGNKANSLDSNTNIVRNYTNKNDFKFSYVFPDTAWDSVWEIRDDNKFLSSLHEDSSGFQRYKDRHGAYKVVESSIKVKRALFGDYYNKVRTFAILSAENPHNKQLTPQENNYRTEKLKSAFREYVLQYKPLQGVYKETKEHSFIVFNCTLNEAKELSERFGQESFFYGEVHLVTNKDKEPIDYSKDERRETRASISYYQYDDDKKAWDLIETSNDIVTDIDFNNFYSKYKDFNFKIDMDIFKENLNSLKAPVNIKLFEKTLNEENYKGYTPYKILQDRIRAYRSKR